MSKFEIVDTITPAMARLAEQEKNGSIDPGLEQLVYSAIQNNGAQFRNHAAVQQIVTELGGTYTYEANLNAGVDLSRGENRFMPYPWYYSPEEELAVLEKDAPLVKVPKSVSAFHLAMNEYALQVPLVIKDTAEERGVAKILLETIEQVQEAQEWLYIVADTEPSLIAEEFIKGPSEYPTTYRITVTPDGQIVSANLKYGKDKIGEAEVKDEDYGRLLRSFNGHMLYGLSSKPKAITSNHATGGETIPLGYSGASVAPAVGRYDAIALKILAGHGIDLDVMKIDPRLEESAIEVAKALGPYAGLVNGIDFIQSRDGEFYFLEINSNPSLNNVRECFGGPAGFWSDDRIYLRAVTNMCLNLAAA